jgi:hypothetical protein
MITESLNPLVALLGSLTAALRHFLSSSISSLPVGEIVKIVGTSLYFTVKCQAVGAIPHSTPKSHLQSEIVRLKPWPTMDPGGKMPLATKSGQLRSSTQTMMASETYRESSASSTISKTWA